jgi:23S rRNA pseudouridine2605 synthase
VDKIRLNSFISRSGLCSRRKADLYILSGYISVNGEIVNKLGTVVDESDRVTFKNKEISICRHFVYILVNKPINCITTCFDLQKRRIVLDLVSSDIKYRVFPVGRLDRNTSGLLLLTNDGLMANLLTHPSSNVKKKYYVILDREISNCDEKVIRNGVYLSDGFFMFDDVTVDNKFRTKILLTLHSGKNRIIRRVFEKLKYSVMSLDRVYYAGLTKVGLKNYGDYRFLIPNEVLKIKEMLKIKY